FILGHGLTTYWILCNIKKAPSIWIMNEAKITNVSPGINSDNDQAYRDLLWGYRYIPPARRSIPRARRRSFQGAAVPPSHRGLLEAHLRSGRILPDDSKAQSVPASDW